MAKERSNFECTACGRDVGFSRNFYKTSSTMYEHLGRLPICKDCMIKEYENYLKLYEKDKKKAVYFTCRKFDVVFSLSYYDGAVSESKKTKKSLFQTYMTKLNSLGNINSGGLTFDNSDSLNLSNREESKKKNDKEDNSDIDFDELSKNIKFTDEDIKTQKDVTRLLGYDPFAGYSKFDQKFLYGELMPYLDEDTLEDQYKLSQIIQLLNNNNQIRKIDLLINKITSNTKMLINNSDQFNSLASIKYKIVQGTDKIAKENSISVKHRGDKKAGKSTLGGTMKKYRELGFEDAEQDYYDQMKAIGMKRTADISNKSIIEQLNFDENDIDTMFKQQKSLIQELQEQKIDLEEEIRKLHVKLVEYKKEKHKDGGA